MKIDGQTLARARLAIETAVQKWIYDPNVTLIDFGWPEHNGEIDKQVLAIRVHVKEKFMGRPALQAAIAEGKTSGPIPDTILGFPVNRPVGTYRPQQWLFGPAWQTPVAERARHTDPMVGGISISDAYRNIYATLGGLVNDRDTHKDMILSNWHVLVGSWGARVGQPIIQPGMGDGGSDADTVGKLSRHAMSSGLDAAVAELSGSRPLINNQLGLGPVKGVVLAEPGMEVVKSGRRTEITYGLVTGIGGVAPMNYSGVDRTIHNVVTIVPRPGFTVISAAGDSGSFWLEEETMNAVGLHFAGSDEPARALAMDMQPVLDALNVEIV